MDVFGRVSNSRRATPLSLLSNAAAVLKKTERLDLWSLQTGASVGCYTYEAPL